MRKKRRSFILIMLIFAACSSEEQDVVPTPKITAEADRNDEQKDAETQKTDEEKEYTAALYANKEDNVYSEIILKAGTVIQYPKKAGYIFNGYYTDTGVCYVNQDGMVTRSYYGVELLELYPDFIPVEYTIVFYNHGKETGIAKRICNYDMNLIEVLPFGELLGDECIIGFQTADKANDISWKDQEIYIKDLKNITEEETVNLEIITTPIIFFGERTVTYEISDSGYFKQKLHAKGDSFDWFSMENINVEALEQLGFREAELEIRCLIEEVDEGDQYIRIYTKQTSEKSDEYLWDSGKIEDGEKGKENIYTMKSNVPIEMLKTQELYIYYDAGGFGGDDWVSRGMDITIRFKK